MSVIYCERGDHYVDTDYEYSTVIGDEEVCGECMTDEECEAEEEGRLLPGEEMDGDFDSGMASAGFGTDEDYGYFGGDE